MRLKTWIFILIGGALLIFGHGLGPFQEVNQDAIAYEASSSTFFLHGGGLSSIDGTASSSTNFIQDAAGGQAISGLASSSVSFISLKGITNLIFRIFIPKYEQIHYHWRNDDETEATATSATSGTEDTVLSSLGLSTVKRIRVEISNEGGVDNISAQQFRLEYGAKITTCAAIGTWTDVSTAGGDWDMGASSLTEAGDTTNVAVATGGVTDANNSFLTPNGGQRETTSQTGNLTVSNNNFVELEYAVQAISPANGDYCFRLTNAGSTTNFTYTQYPETSVSGSSSLTLTLDGGGVIALGTISSGTRLTGTTRLKVTQTSATSMNITAGRQRANSTPATLASDAAPNVITNQIDDDIDGIDVFNGISNCATVSSHPTTWPSQTGVSTGLGFSNWADSTGKDTTCWGTGTTATDSLNQYAVLQASSSASSFINIASSPPATLFASVGYSLEVKSTQKSTSYSGGVVFTATSLP